MTMYQQYEKLAIDLSRLGLARGEPCGDYFCTPKGAKVIGWEGVDGIHYCFVKGFGDMVFAVNPSNLPGDHVHPLARSFEDFLRLLLSCGGTAAMEQARLWDREGFNAFVEEYPPGPEQLAALGALRDQLGLTPMEDPYGYIRSLQAEFDYGAIPYRKDYYDCVPEGPKTPERPEWRVYFAGGFGRRHVGHDRPGKEIPVNQVFTWGGRVWHIPAVYACGQGLVMDLCMEVEPDQLRAFLDRWAAREEEGRDLTQEEEERLTAENPQAFGFTPRLTVNGRELRRGSGNGFGWVPAAIRPDYARGEPNQQDWESIWLMEHYGLDPRRGWVFSRESFPWATKARPVLRALTLHLTQDPQPVPGPRFTVSGPGDTVPFTHPVTGEAHTLHVVEYETQEIDSSRFYDADSWEYPTHYAAMSYVVEPELPKGELALRDCGAGDHPRARMLDPSGPTAVNSVGVIGIIGGSDGPTAILLTNGRTGHPRAACSALRFEPPERIEWRMVFYRKTVEDLDAELPLP